MQRDTPINQIGVRNAQNPSQAGFKLMRREREKEMTTATKLTLQDVTEMFDGKVSGEDVQANTFLTEFVVDYLKNGNLFDSDFLHSVRDFGFRYKKISAAQAAGVLNTLIAKAKNQRKVPVPVLTNQEEAPAPNLSMPAEGFYTVIFGEDEDDYVTLKVESADWAKDLPAGSMSIKYLAGPENTSDYVGFGFYVPQRTFIEARIWKRYSENRRLRDAAAVVLGDPEMAGKAFAEMSGHCRRCNRMLTVPASLHSGYGPECRKRLA